MGSYDVGLNCIEDELVLSTLTIRASIAIVIVSEAKKIKFIL